MADGWNKGGALGETPDPTLGARTDRGWELPIRPRGIGRWFSAAFLLVWLTGWALGEAFAIAFLVRGAIAWAGATPSPMPVGAGAIAMAAFLLVWLLLWTVGGVAALHELLRLVWGRTLVIVAPDRLIVEHRAGPFRSRKEVSRESVQTVRVLTNRGDVIVESASGRIDVARTLDRAEALRLVGELRRELGLDDPDRASAVTLPPGWKEWVTAEGGVAAIADPTVRSRQARVLGVLTLIVGSVALLTARQWLQGPAGLHEPGMLSLTLVFGIVALGFLAGTVWLARGRNEWRVDRGRIVLQRRFGDDASERFVATALELTRNLDSDGDEWFTLTAMAGPAVESEASRTLASLNPAFRDPGVPRTPSGRTIIRVMNDASAPRNLGRWLAARSEVPFVDRSTAEAQAVDLKELRARLASSGRLGALAERWIGKLDRR